MQSTVYSNTGAESGKKDLPPQFTETVRPDVIQRTVHAMQMSRRQSYGTETDSGQKQVTRLSKKRRSYRGIYGYGFSRAPRKVLWQRGQQFYWIGAEAPFAVGGRRAHPPKVEKRWDRQVNTKERRLAIRSAISATAEPSLVQQRHNYSGSVPLVVDKTVESVKKTREMQRTLTALGLEDELKRAKERKQRPGKGTMRNRPYKHRRGPLLVYAKDNGVCRAARNIPGVEAVEARHVNTELLAPGAQPGRLTIWSTGALDKLEKEQLFW